MAEQDPSIQGYHDGVFWERNSLSEQRRNGMNGKRQPTTSQPNSLFGQRKERLLLRR